MKRNIIKIDLDTWTTQATKAKVKGCTPEYISKLIRKGKLKSWKIEELGINLVEK